MKKPGDFKKQQKKHQNIQHNRDQLKLLREELIQEAELFVLDPDGFKKVTIKPMPEHFDCERVVYLQRRRNKTKLQTGILTTASEYPRVRVNGIFVEREDVFGIIVKEENFGKKVA